MYTSDMYKTIILVYSQNFLNLQKINILEKLKHDIYNALLHQKCKSAL